MVVPDIEGGPRHPVMMMDGKMIFTRTQAGLRIAGQVELATLALLVAEVLDDDARVTVADAHDLGPEELVRAAVEAHGPHARARGAVRWNRALVFE